ncbi:MAG: hypothetical protein HYR98_08270 [Nitrospirae bacterium]|nr:hypothetical protein [Nitrospirota bacterium]
MSTGLKAVEVTGMIDNHRQLHLGSLPPIPPGPVRVIILVPEETAMEEGEWLQGAATSPAFEFLRTPEEDIYTLADGKPFRDQG